MLISCHTTKCLSGQLCFQTTPCYQLWSIIIEKDREHRKFHVIYTTQNSKLSLHRPFFSLDDEKLWIEFDGKTKRHKQIDRILHPPTVSVRNKSTTSTALPAAVLLCYFCTQSIKFIFACTQKICRMYLAKENNKRAKKRQKGFQIHSAGNKL